MLALKVYGDVLYRSRDQRPVVEEKEDSVLALIGKCCSVDDLEKPLVRRTGKVDGSLLLLLLFLLTPMAVVVARTLLLLLLLLLLL